MKELIKIMKGSHARNLVNGGLSNFYFVDEKIVSASHRNIHLHIMIKVSDIFDVFVSYRCLLFSMYLLFYSTILPEPRTALQ